MYIVYDLLAVGPILQVLVVDMDRRQSECRSVGDPHLTTFDGRSVILVIAQ